MATDTATPRTVQMEEAARNEKTLRENREKASATYEDYQRQIAELTAHSSKKEQELRALNAEAVKTGDVPVAGQKLASEIQAITIQIGQLVALEHSALERSQELSAKQAEHGRGLERAHNALRREACEAHLAQIDKFFRQAEKEWVLAGDAAMKLEQSGDQWGRNALNGFHFRLQHSSTGQPWTVKLPQLSDHPSSAQ